MDTPLSSSEPALYVPPSAPPRGPAHLPIEPPRSGSRRLLWTIILVIVVGVLGGGYFAYSRGYLAVPFLTPPADQLFDRMVTTLSDIKNAQYSLRLSVKAENRAAGAQPLVSKGELNVNLVPSSGSGLGAGLAALFDPDVVLKALPADIDLTLGTTIYTEADKKIKDSNGLLKIDGSYVGGDASYALDIEARKIQDTVYGLVNKFPSLPFFDLSAVKGKWVSITPDDTDLFSDDALDQIDNRRTIEQMKTNLRRALDDKVFTVDRKLPAETVTGVRSEHHRLAVDPTKLPDLYRHLIETKKGRGEKTDDLEKILADLGRIETQDIFKRVAKNSVIEVWIDRVSGMLRQVAWTLVVVPPEGNEKLKDKQFRISLQLTLEKVNQNVRVDRPLNPIDYDEAVRLVTGISKKEQLFNKQMDRVANIRSGLDQYHRLTKNYPSDIDALATDLKKAADDCLAAEQREQAANANGNTNSNVNGFRLEPLSRCSTYGLATRKFNPTDVYTKKPFVYSRNGDDYTFVYTVELPDEPGQSYYAQQVAAGKNTATSKDLSTEKKSSFETPAAVNLNLNANTNTAINTNVTVNLDGDRDGLTDTTEQLYKTNANAADSDGDGVSDFGEVLTYRTNPWLTDTDGDGYTDGQEVSNGYSPAGPDKLNAAGSHPAADAVIKPTISAVSAASSHGWVTVRWAVTPDADGVVNYGPSPTYGSLLSNKPFTAGHALSFQAPAGQTQHYAIRSCTTKGTCATTADATLTVE